MGYVGRSSSTGLGGPVNPHVKLTKKRCRPHLEKHCLGRCLALFCPATCTFFPYSELTAYFYFLLFL